MYRPTVQHLGLAALFALAMASCAASPVVALMQGVAGDSIVCSPVFWCLGALALATTAGAWEGCRWAFTALVNHVRIRRCQQRVIH